MDPLENGATYSVESQRKGNFVGRLVHHCATWAVLEITKGRTSAMMAYNECGPGEEVTVRRSMATLTKVT
jgi:hypothetical protein